MKNILLIGIGGTYNYGCEAIVRGTVNILKSVYSSVEISYASYNYQDDVRRLKDCDVTVINRPKRKRWSFHNIIRKLASIVNLEYQVPYDSLDWVKKYDIIFSIGGDIYTLNPNNGFSAELPIFCEKCASLGIKYILWGASVGKFEKNARALQFYKEHLPKIDLIVAREKNTVDYLKSIGVDQNVVLAPDPAYFVAPEITVSDNATSNNVLGINLSPLSAQYEYGSTEIAMDKQAKAISALIDELGSDILLLPHVISPSYLDNDLLYMKDMYSKIPDKYRSKVRIVDSDPKFVGLKSEILKCDMVIAARMHCAINAISTGIPALFLAYSEKAKGMSEFIYNSTDPTLLLTDFENTSLIVSLVRNWHYQSNLELIRAFDFNKILNRFFI